MLTEADILEALRVCYDPDLGINIVDLGRVHAIHVAPNPDAPGLDPRVEVRIELLPRNEEQDPILAALVTNRLYGFYEVFRAEVVILPDPLWTPDRMTAAARAERSRQQGLIQLGRNPAQ